MCRNMLADALLKYYQSLCGRHKIRFECAADLPEEIEMEDTDFTILFGNLLENAWEAARKRKEDGYIKVQIQDQGNQIIACIENSYDQQLLSEKKGFRSTKHEGMGIGTRSARLVVEKWNGRETAESFGCGSYCHKNALMWLKNLDLNGTIKAVILDRLRGGFL